MESILERIKEIMDKEGISPSALADQIGISRPLMSHVMSGRNKPSLQLVLKLLEHYPHYSADWLLLGKSVETHIQTEVPLASPGSVTDPLPPPEPVTSPPPVQKPQLADQPLPHPPSETEQVIVFYGDKTYSVYKPR